MATVYLCLLAILLTSVQSVRDFTSAAYKSGLEPYITGNQEFGGQIDDYAPVTDYAPAPNDFASYYDASPNFGANNQYQPTLKYAISPPYSSLNPLLGINHNRYGPPTVPIYCDNPTYGGPPIYGEQRFGGNSPPIVPISSDSTGSASYHNYVGDHSLKNGLNYGANYLPPLVINPVVGPKHVPAPVPINPNLYNHGTYDKNPVTYSPTKCSDLGSAVNASYCCSGTNGFIDNTGVDKCCLVTGSSCSTTPGMCCNGQVCRVIGNPALGIHVCTDSSYILNG